MLLISVAVLSILEGGSGADSGEPVPLAREEEIGA